MVVWWCFGNKEEVPTPTNTNNPTTPNTSTSPAEPLPDWLIPENMVFDGGPGKDGIPSVDRPGFSDQSSIDFLSPNDLVVAANFGNEARAYPHPILEC